MTTLKVKVSSKEKTTKELEDKIDDMRKLHWDKEKNQQASTYTVNPVKEKKQHQSLQI